MRKILTSLILTALIASTAFSQVIQEKTGSSGESKGKKILTARFKNDPKEYQLHASMVILSTGKLKGAYYAHNKNSGICATMYFFENTTDTKAAIMVLLDYYKAVGIKLAPIFLYERTLQNINRKRKYWMILQKATLYSGKNRQKEAYLFWKSTERYLYCHHI